MRIGYARVSTIDQNLDLQRDALRAAGCGKIYEDEGISGARAIRPGLEDTLQCLKSGDVLVVWKLDRLGRSLRHLIDLIGELERRDVEFISLSDGIDTATPLGKLFFHITGAFGEYERNLISERTKAGMAAAKARGVKLGRPRKRSKEHEDAAAEFCSDTLDAAARGIGADKRFPTNSKRTLQ